MILKFPMDIFFKIIISLNIDVVEQLSKVNNVLREKINDNRSIKNLSEMSALRYVNWLLHPL